VAVAEGQKSPRELKVAAVQFRSSFHVQDNLQRMSKVLSDLAMQGVQVAAFPECALTGYYRTPEMPTPEKEIADAEERLEGVCRTNKIAAVIGSVYKVQGHTYDTAIVIDSRGKVVERYGKIYLAAEKWAVPGNHIAYFDLEGVPSSVLICHDERYPEIIRLPALQGARIVYYISSESPVKFESKLAPYRAQMMARAVENRISVVAANAPANDDLSGSHGESRIIADDGNVLAEATIFGEDALVRTLTISSDQSGWQTKVLHGPMQDWWQAGLDWMMKNRNRPLE